MTLATRVTALFAAISAASSSAGVASRPFSTSGSKVFDAAGNWVVFKGIGLSCTEYFARPNMPVPAPAAPEAAAAGGPLRARRERRLEDWPGEYDWNACFGGAPALLAPEELAAIQSALELAADIPKGARHSPPPLPPPASPPPLPPPPFLP